MAGFYKKELEGFNLPLAEIREGLEPVFLRFPVLVAENTDDILRKAREKRMFLDDGWRKSPIVPLGSDILKMNYILGSCKKAEKVAQDILNLPTHINISEKEAGKIVKFLKEYGDKKD